MHRPENHYITQYTTYNSTKNVLVSINSAIKSKEKQQQKILLTNIFIRIYSYTQSQQFMTVLCFAN